MVVTAVITARMTTTNKKSIRQSKNREQHHYWLLQRILLQRRHQLLLRLTQNAATAAEGDVAATTTDSPIAATAAQASTAEGTPEFIDQSTPPPRGSQKRSAQPSSKSKQRKKLRKDAQCRKGARVKVTRNTLYHVLQDDAQKESTKQYGNHHNFFGRKPVPLGTMFRNGMYCLSGVFAYQDVVMNP
jgi:hypothetical protein